MKCPPYCKHSEPARCVRSPQDSRRASIALAAVIFTLAEMWGFPTASADSSPGRVRVSDISVAVSADRQWTDSGVEIAAGEVITISSQGRIVACCSDRWGHRNETRVGPEGTYLVNDGIANQNFPLPSGAHGPAPPFCLIGRIGDGPIFYVGPQKSWTAERSGTLWLGINDFSVPENTGTFQAQITRSGSLQPVTYDMIMHEQALGGRPVPGCSVVVFYVDGLRPDVVMEMASMGHLPNIKRVFVDGGVWLSNAFTAFPSDTITSNGTMWTGCFSDRHGLKGQVRFSRRRLVSESYLDPLGPNRSARLLAPQGVDKLLHSAQVSSRRFVTGEDSSRRWEATQITGVPPIYVHLRKNGGDWGTGALPLMTEMPPLLWTRSMAGQMPLLRAQESWQYMDDANTNYAIRHLLPENNPVTIVWLPETDSVSHKQCRGQFGMTRRTIAKADALIGRMIEELEAQGRLNSTYLVLVSDHGHHGGRTTHLSHFDLANELFYRPRAISSDGRWVGGGLGVSIRQHRVSNRHPEDGRRQFVFVDGDSDGVARIFLPRGAYDSDDWSGPNRPGDLLRYPIAPNRPAVNLVETLVSARAIAGDGTESHPIDLVLMKADENSVLIATADRGYAVIERVRDGSHRWLYRYMVVTDVRSTSTGAVVWQLVESPTKDPLGLLEWLPAHALAEYSDERFWLEATAYSNYPDSVVTMSRNVLWQENLAAREAEFAPDLIVTARPKWYFGTESSPGTMHGYPFPDAMHVTWFVSGPNIPRGTRIDRACRLADLTPTLLDMVGVPVDSADFDGSALRNIYSSDSPIVTVSLRPSFWDDYDLHAWRQPAYQPVPEFEHRPWSINRPLSAFDLHSITYNLLSLGELNVFRMIDDALSPIVPEHRRFVSGFVDRTDLKIRRISPRWLSDAVRALNVPETTLTDYSYTSLGNMKRVDGVIDWTQQRGLALDRRIAHAVGRETLPGSGAVHGTIDTAQRGFWEIYRFAQRVAIQVVDETVLSGIEDQTDRTVNTWHTLPAELPAAE